MQQCARCKEAEKWAGSELNVISLFFLIVQLSFRNSYRDLIISNMPMCEGVIGLLYS